MKTLEINLYVIRKSINLLNVKYSHARRISIDKDTSISFLLQPFCGGGAPGGSLFKEMLKQNLGDDQNKSDGNVGDGQDTSRKESLNQLGLF